MSAKRIIYWRSFKNNRGSKNVLNFINILYECLTHHSDLRLSCWYLEQGLHLKFLFYGLLTYVNYNHDYDVNWFQKNPILYRHAKMTERSLTTLDSIEPWSVSASLVWWMDLNVNCSLPIVPVVRQSTISAVLRIWALVIVQIKLHNILCWSEALHWINCYI